MYDVTKVGNNFILNMNGSIKANDKQVGLYTIKGLGLSHEFLKKEYSSGTEK